MRRFFVTFCILVCAATAFAQEGRDATPVIKKHLDELGYKYGITKLGNFMLDFDILDAAGKATGRSQRIFICSKTEKWEDLEVIRIWSTAMKSKSMLSQKQANDFLVENYKEKFGRWEVSKGSEGYRVMFVIKLSVREPAPAYKKAIQNVFGKADAIEKLITGKDAY